MPAPPNFAMPPSRLAQQFVLRFEQTGHRDRLKIQAIKAKRSLNKQILHLIEAGEHALCVQQPTPQQADQPSRSNREHHHL